jgi:hypothetical protein
MIFVLGCLLVFAFLFWLAETLRGWLTWMGETLAGGDRELCFKIELI